MSKQKGKLSKTEAYSFFEDALVTTELSGTDHETLPFQEWNDLDINMEKWDLSAGTKDKIAQFQETSTSFEDHQQVHLPPSIFCDSWKKLSEVFSNVNFVIFVNKPTYPDLISNSRHVLHSYFYRSFISSIETLLYIGSTMPFPEEHGTTGFAAAVGRFWRPWHHIYSNCKIQKNQGEHTPLYNPSGKYVVRLFWMGSWRKIYVDDYLPLDKSENLLLPTLIAPKKDIEVVDEEADKSPKSQKSTKRPKSKDRSLSRKETVEIWPFLLCKALLKIGCLSWSSKRELNHFDIIQCLTGWVPQRIRTDVLNSTDLWELLMAYVRPFEWDEDKKHSSSSKQTASSKQSKMTSKETGKKSKTVIPSGIENMREGDYFVIAACDNFELSLVKERNNSVVTNSVFLNQIRDIPLIKPPPRPELAYWQTFRYEYWATEQGIIPPDIKKLNIKSLNIVSPFDQLANKMKTTEGGDDFSDTSPELEALDKKSDKSSKSSKKTAKMKSMKNQLQPDPSFWIDFSEIQDTLLYITIYFQPRLFKSRAKVSDLNFLYKATDYKHIVNPLELSCSRNEPVYIFLDSIDSKFLVINFSQTGNTEHLERTTEETMHSLASCEGEDLDFCLSLLLKKTEETFSLNMDQFSSSQWANKSFFVCPFNTKPVNFLLEEYYWRSNSFGRAATNIQTVGSKSVMLEAKPGRVCFRLWISSHCSYVIQLFCDTPLTIGCLEEFYTACATESESLTNKCYELSDCFGKLVQSFGTEDYELHLKNFFLCYKSEEDLKKKDSLIIHKAFLDELYKMISANCSLPNSLDCTKLILLQLKTFDYINPYSEDDLHVPEEIFENINQTQYYKEMQKAAVKIQAFFKGIYIRRIMKKMNENHKQYFSIFETLKKVYQEIFSSEKRLNFCPTLFRRFFEREDMKHFKEKFDLYKDMASVLALINFNNAISVPEPRWVCICRYQFHINSTKPLFIKINLFCNLDMYYVRVFDNDSQKEMKRYTTNVAVEEYASNIHGYTVLCYAFVKEPRKVYWKLIIATQKMSRHDLIILQQNNVASISFTEPYMPNFNQKICRYCVKVDSESFLTAHLTTSYDNARMKLKLLDSKNKVLREASGIGGVLLPLMHLHDSKSNEDDNASKLKKSTETCLSEVTYGKLGETKTKKKKSRASVEIKQDNFKHGSTQDLSMKGDSISKRSVSLKLKSSEKLSQRSATSQANRNNEKMSDSLAKLTEAIRSEYVLEANVVDQSWPLTSKEWTNVQNCRKSQYLYQTTESDEKHKVTPSQKKPHLATEPPFFVLDLVYGAAEGLEFLEDNLKLEKRKRTKRKWFEKDKGRFSKAREFRTQFLNNHTIIRKLSLKDGDRSNTAEDFLEKIVEEFPIEEFLTVPLESVDDDTCKVKRDADYIAEERALEETLEAYENEEKLAKEKLNELINKQIEDLSMLNSWFEEIRGDSSFMIQEALNEQHQYLKKVEQEIQKDKSAKKGGDKKNKKKK
ncbi:androglobin-like [Sitophilus oryzae]|uniref:Androglobin-like n=1 Tax=Sitophilus oryzae TaxID=7048 RepID=A0A6J2Y7Y6_SITOR|nr:androglobin-like [Sitophilus oryzae]